MKNKKIKLAIIFGGRSAEHEVSVISARNILKAIDKNKYDITLVGIDKRGNWLSFSQKELLSGDDKLFLKKSAVDLVIPFSKDGKFHLKIKEKNKNIQAVFPVLHGPFGEDGTIQGLFKIYNVPFVGPGVLGSAVAMDKDVAKRLFKEAGLPIGKFKSFHFEDKSKIVFAEIKKYLGLPFFIKPANLGSLVGISKVRNEKEFKKALKLAFDFDNKIVIEEFIQGKEIECAVLGNENPQASTVGEIIPTHDFYSYEAKYLDENGAKMKIPADISENLIKEFQNLSIKAFKTLNCEGISRVDFFLTKNNKIYINEINTIPGFTSISMYPKLWEASGLSYAKLIDRVIELAIDRHEKEIELKN
ncbi:MAG: D-alanine--D-alanine ligase [Candidatus Moraniibacteriota bacterium]